MKPIASLLLTAALCAPMVLAAQAQPEAPAAKAPAPKAKPFEISHGNLFEALRQIAAYRKLDLVIDPDVPNRTGLYAFKHTSWEKALETILVSHGLNGEIKDGILRVRLAAATADGAPAAGTVSGRAAARTISITYRPAAQGEALLSVTVNGVTRAEILEALSKIERLAKAKADKQPFNANWVLHPLKNAAKEELETFTMEDITPGGLRALYP